MATRKTGSPLVHPRKVAGRCARCARKFTGYDYYCQDEVFIYCVECNEIMNGTKDSTDDAIQEKNQEQTYRS